MRRPSFQFYPADWLSNAELKGCTHAERGAWMDILCLMHQSDEYGVLRMELKRLAYMIGARKRVCQSLFEKHVLQGSDCALSCPLIFTPYHGGKHGNPVTLIPAQQGPIWFCGRLVRDEYKRMNAGKDTRFGSPSRRDGDAPSQRDGDSPSQRQVDGSSSSTSTSSSSKTTTPEPVDNSTGTATANQNQRRGFVKTTDQKTNPSWEVPSLDDQYGLDKFARDNGVKPESFASYPLLQKHLIGMVRERNEKRRSAKPG